MKILQIIIIFFGLIIIVSCSQQNKHLADNEKEVLSAILSDIEDSSFLIYPIIYNIDIDKEHLPTLINKLTETYRFKKEQIIRIPVDSILISDFKQYEILNPDSIRSYERTIVKNSLTLDPIMKTIQERDSKSGICYLFRPIFNVDNQYALVQYQFECGFMCGYGKLLLMKKEKEKWIIQEVLISNIR